jgi:hypothetical protein
MAEVLLLPPSATVSASIVSWKSKRLTGTEIFTDLLRELTEGMNNLEYYKGENITMKMNCWEFKDCGRELGGKNVSAMGVCPTATDARLHGVHGGKNSGRACWVIAGTLCGGKVQGSFGMKYKNCEQCDFYKKVRIEEGSNFQLSVLLLNKLKDSLCPTSS